MGSAKILFANSQRKEKAKTNKIEIEKINEQTYLLKAWRIWIFSLKPRWYSRTDVTHQKDQLSNALLFVLPPTRTHSDNSAETEITTPNEMSRYQKLFMNGAKTFVRMKQTL